MNPVKSLGLLVGVLAAAGATRLLDDARKAAVGVADAPPPTLSVHFSPGGGCTAAVVAEVGGARRRVRVLAYSFTSAPIAAALVAAKARGVDVAAVLDEGQRTDPHSKGKAVAAAGVPVAYDARHAIQHSKVVVVDDDTVISGSFNFSEAAEVHNSENLLIIHDKAVAAAYLANWGLHRAHADPPPSPPGKGR
jgi:phosphatidylserine/phosphatidylglycerophosphate/cardiolipin synthase-like enzyme